MATSICILGYGKLARSLVSKIKSYEDYNNEFKLHCIHVRDSNDPKYQDLITTIEYTKDNWLQVLADGTENTDRFTPFGGDLEWLLDSGGHNIVVDCMDYNEDSKNLIFDMIKKGNKFYYIIPDPVMRDLHKDYLQSLLTIHGGQINFDSSEVTGIPAVIDVIYDQVLERHSIEMKAAEEWAKLSEEEKKEKEAHWAAEEEKRIKAAKEEELRLSGEPCGLGDSFSWKDLD